MCRNCRDKNRHNKYQKSHNRHKKKCNSNYNYIRSLFPRECRKYLDDIKYNTDKMYYCMKKDIMKKYFKK